MYVLTELQTGREFWPVMAVARPERTLPG